MSREVDRKLEHLMWQTFGPGRCEDRYAEAAEIAAEEARRVAWFSPDWFKYKNRARYYRRCSR